MTRAEYDTFIAEIYAPRYHRPPEPEPRPATERSLTDSEMLRWRESFEARLQTQRAEFEQLLEARLKIEREGMVKAIAEWFDEQSEEMLLSIRTETEEMSALIATLRAELTTFKALRPEQPTEVPQFLPARQRHELN